MRQGGCGLLRGGVAAGTAASRSARHGQYTQQMVPTAAWTRLHYVGGVIMWRLLQGGDLGALGDASTVFW